MARVSWTDEVEQFIETLDHPLKAEIEQLRTIILSADSRITERIKWNAPSFCFDGDDRVTMKLYPKDRVQLIFHRGARPKDHAGFFFRDDSGLMTWAAKDRAVVSFRGMQEVESNRAALKDLVTRWVGATT